MATRLSALRAGRPLPPGRFLVLISVRGFVVPRVIVRLEGLCHLKIPVISPGIETATFRLVAQCLNQLRYRLSPEHFFALWENEIIKVCQRTEIPVVLITAMRTV
jgi:hypothetical protein